MILFLVTFPSTFFSSEAPQGSSLLFCLTLIYIRPVILSIALSHVLTLGNLAG